MEFNMRFGGRTIDTGAWVEGTGFFWKIWWEKLGKPRRQEAWYILEGRPSGLEVKREIKPESFRIEVGELWYTQEEITAVMKDRKPSGTKRKLL